jgi:drug/metabolite transporter (DMT)-like permease
MLAQKVAIELMDSFLVATIAVLLAGGQFLFKSAGISIRGLALADGLRTLIWLPGFYVALSMYAIATVLWIYVLSRIPLTIAYPWIAAATAAVPIIGWLAFGEKTSLLFWVGIAFITFGLFLTQLGASR